MPAARATKAEIARAIDAVTERGLPVRSVEIGPDGTIRVLIIDTDAPAIASVNVEAWEE